MNTGLRASTFGVRRTRRAAFAAGVAVAAVGYLASGLSAQAPSPAARAPVRLGASERTLLDTYCVTCHSERLKRGNLTLETKDVNRVGQDIAVWEKVARKLRGGVMPPAGSPRPDQATYDALIASLEGKLDQAAASAPDPGRPIVHRLNRAEYANAIRDLLGMEIDAPSLLPADTSGYGFDNIADVLSMSPGLLERYMSVARKISRLALGDPTLREEVHTYKVSPMTWQDDRVEGLPFGTRGGVVIDHYFPLDGEYLFTIDLKRGYYEDILGRHEPNDVDLRLDGARLKRFSIAPTTVYNQSTATAQERRTDDNMLELRIPVRAGTRAVGIGILKRTSALTEGLGPTRLPIGGGTFLGQIGTSEGFGKIEMRIGTVEIRGPLGATAPAHTEARTRILVCHPPSTSQGEACARTILSRLAHRAYRQPVAAEDLQALVAFYKEGEPSGGFEGGIQLALERLLISPAFLFRAERTPAHVPPGAVYAIGDVELASRLSFFLWSSIPDAVLLEVAERGRLRNPAVLAQQVRRMLQDPRAEALVTNFFGQWLFLRNMRTHVPDAQMFPDFDEELREALERETSLFLNSQIREDRSVVELLTANYTFVNERLARHYGMRSVVGSHFRRVTYSDDRRAGLLGQGSILTVTSYTNRTSPVLRGKWLLENILGTPPPDPPANVPKLKEDEAGKPTASVRARMEQHRRNPVCASCHAQIDPLGFSLENFDAVGAWRDADGHTIVDPSGAFPDGSTFDGPGTFRGRLLQRREAFVATLTEKLLTYALGRGVEPYDMPVVRAIVRDARAGEFRWSSLILGIVRSMPFQMRRSES